MDGWTQRVCIRQARASRGSDTGGTPTARPRVCAGWATRIDVLGELFRLHFGKRAFLGYRQMARLWMSWGWHAVRRRQRKMGRRHSARLSDAFCGFVYSQACLRMSAAAIAHDAALSARRVWEEKVATDTDVVPVRHRRRRAWNVARSALRYRARCSGDLGRGNVAALWEGEV